MYIKDSYLSNQLCFYYMLLLKEVKKNILTI